MTFLFVFQLEGKKPAILFVLDLGLKEMTHF